jgi:hypothetical protein
MSPSLCFLGITDSTWAFINSFAGWFSAFGSIAAVVTALYLARNQSRPKLRASIGHRLLVSRGNPGHRPEYICINAVNIGARKVRITNLGGRVGYFKKRHFIIISPDNPISHKLPVEIEPGQEANWFIDYELESGETWPDNMVKDLITSNNLRSLRFYIYTSVGNVFRAGIEKNIIELLKKACENQKMGSHETVKG